MGAAEDLFKKLSTFKRYSRSGQSPGERLHAYCIDVLGTVERVHFDFKTKQDRRNPRPDESDKRNLAKATSGFANSAGGVLIWGLDDKTLSRKPITDAEGFLSALMQLAPLATEPPVQAIDGVWIPNGGTGTSEGYAVLLVPESTLPPHRVELNISEAKDKYYIRSGQDFVVATHSQLEDMFGRRPKPKLAISQRYVGRRRQDSGYIFRIVVGIRNDGRGTAKAPYLKLGLSGPGTYNPYGIDGNYRFGLPRLVLASDVGMDEYGSSADMVIHPGTVREVTQIEVKVDARVDPSEATALTINYWLAAEGVNLVNDSIVYTGAELWKIAKTD